jgi:hypothetical protein
MISPSSIAIGLATDVPRLAEEQNGPRSRAPDSANLDREIQVKFGCQNSEANPDELPPSPDGLPLSSSVSLAIRPSFEFATNRKPGKNSTLSFRRNGGDRREARRHLRSGVTKSRYRDATS